MSDRSLSEYTFTKAQVKQRRIFRLAQIIYDHWEEKAGMDTRYFDHPFIHNEHVEYGHSIAGGAYREHAVPRAYLRDQCMSLFSTGASVEDVASVLEANLRIVRITSEEAELLNRTHKSDMPANWEIGKDDPLERFHLAGIKVVEKSVL
jgi:hypothetical protein